MLWDPNSDTLFEWLTFVCTTKGSTKGSMKLQDVASPPGDHRCGCPFSWRHVERWIIKMFSDLFLVSCEISIRFEASSISFVLLFLVIFCTCVMMFTLSVEHRLNVIKIHVFIIYKVWECKVSNILVEIAIYVLFKFDKKKLEMHRYWRNWDLKKTIYFQRIIFFSTYMLCVEYNIYE